MRNLLSVPNYSKCLLQSDQSNSETKGINLINTNIIIIIIIIIILLLGATFASAFKRVR